MRAFLLSLSTKFQVLFIVGLTIAIAFLVAATCSMFFDEHQLRANTDLISSIYQVMGTIYAILLTFTLWGVWQNFSNADTSVQKEAYTLLNLVHLINASSAWKNIPFQAMALVYLKSVIEQEWPRLKNLTNCAINTNTHSHVAAFQIRNAVQSINPINTQEIALFTHSLTIVNEWLDARRSRLLIARGNSARALWPLLFTGAFVLFLFHGLFVANTIGIWSVLLFGTSLVIGLTFYLIFTLDCPFAGSPSIDSEPFTLAIDILTCKNSDPVME